jgi:D-alanine-D-alanine ligase-like ATP-grasp enzyme
MRDRIAAAALAVPTRAGRPGRELGARVDLVASTGVRQSLRRALQEPRLRAFRDELYEELWGEAAAAIGATVVRRPSALLEVRRGGQRTWVQRQEVALDHAMTLRASLEKSLAHDLLTELGIPVPEHVVFDAVRLAPALDFLERHPGGVVVKPAGGTGGGIGITASVRTERQLRRAVLFAARKSSRVLVEALAGGDVHRVLFLDGELLDVVRREPPHVVGDGRASVRELIDRENTRRLEARGRACPSFLTITLDCVFELAKAGRTLATVPAAGERVRVKATTNHSGPADCHTVRTPLAVDAVEELGRAVAATGLRLAGVDVVTPDVTVPLAQSGGVVLEVNGNPALHQHYQVADPENATRVCVPVLRRVFESRPPWPGVPAA